MIAQLTARRIIGFFVVLAATIAAIFTIVQVTNGKEKEPFALTPEELLALCSFEEREETVLSGRFNHYQHKYNKPPEIQLNGKTVGHGWFARLSPDRSQIAYEKNHKIFVVNSDGSNERQITNPWRFSSDQFPSWSPDSEYIVFTRTASGFGLSELFVVDVSSGELLRLTERDEWSLNYEPSSPWYVWSEDGKVLLFDAFIDPTNEHALYMVNVSWEHYNPSAWKVLDGYFEPVLFDNGIAFARYNSKFSYKTNNEEIIAVYPGGLGITETRDITPLCKGL